MSSVGCSSFGLLEDRAASQPCIVDENERDICIEHDVALPGRMRRMSVDRASRASFVPIPGCRYASQSEVCLCT